MIKKIDDEQFLSIMTGPRAARLRELLNKAKPYGRIEDVITEERTQANQEFFFLAYDLMPFILDYVDGKQQN